MHDLGVAGFLFALVGGYFFVASYIFRSPWLFHPRGR